MADTMNLILLVLLWVRVRLSAAWDWMEDLAGSILIYFQITALILMALLIIALLLSTVLPTITIYPAGA